MHQRNEERKFIQVVIDGDKLASVGVLLAKEAQKPTYWRV